MEAMFNVDELIVNNCSAFGSAVELRVLGLGRQRNRQMEARPFSCICKNSTCTTFFGCTNTTDALPSPRNHKITIL